MLSADPMPPSLAAAFVDYRSLLAFAAIGSPTVETTAPSGGTSLDSERIVRRHRLGEAGVVTTSIALGVEIVGVVIEAVGIVENDDDLVLSGAVISLAGNAGEIVGEVLMFTGGIGAAQLLGIPTTVGWVGVGLAIGGNALSLYDPTLGGLAALGGLVCGAVQLGESGNAMRSQGLTLHVIPTGNGVRFAGTF
jgi:hypothetical protein